MHQKWEYLHIFRKRVYRRESGRYFNAATNWETTATSEGGQKKVEAKDFFDFTNKLGDDGWELVAISPRSGMLGGEGMNISLDFAGFTNEEMWVFKRPKE